MIKKNDWNINSSTNNGFTYIDYTPSFVVGERQNIKIHDAIMTLKLNRFSDTPSGVYVRNAATNALIDYIFPVNSDNIIAINIAEELQNALKSNTQVVGLALAFTNDAFRHDITHSKNQVTMLYTHKKSQDVKAGIEFDAGRAGSGTVNLNNGVLNFSHSAIDDSGLAIPVSLSQNFSMLRAGMVGDSVMLNAATKNIPDFNCGKGWKLNAQQYIVKEKAAVNFDSDKDTSESFTYVNGEGQHIVFKERYYYLSSNKEKVFLKNTDVTIDLDGKLSYKDSNNKVYEVEKEVVSDSGLTLNTEIGGYKNIHLIEKDIEEVAQLKAQVKQLKEEMTRLEDSLAATEEGIGYAAIQMQISKMQNFIQDHSHKYSKAKNALQIIKKGDIYNVNSGIEANSSAKNLADFDYNATYIGRTEGSNVFYPFTSYENIINDETDLLVNGKAYSETIAALLNGLAFTTEQRTEILQLLNDMSPCGYSELAARQLVSQIKRALKDCEKIKKTKKEYQDKLTQLEHQLDKLTKQIPVHFITNGGSTLGFAPTAIDNVYRLVMQADSYENAIVYEYDKQNKLIAITDIDGKSIVFKYDDSKLISIKNSDSSQVQFEYSSNYLAKVIYPDGSSSIYKYDGDKLSQAVSHNGTGKGFSYTGSVLTFVFDIAYYDHINESTIEKNLLEETMYMSENNTTISYDGNRCTKVTDDKSGQVTTYIFDKYGNVTTVYENELESSDGFGNVDVTTFDYVKNARSFKIKPLMNAENLLNVTRVYENYVGEARCADGGISLGSSLAEAAGDGRNDIINLAGGIYTVCKTEQIAEGAQLQRIIGTGATDFVLSGWAKADAAYTSRRITDYCGQGDNCAAGDELDDIEKIMQESTDLFKGNRKFELRAELIYSKTDGTLETVTQCCSFDWANTDWQYCTFPVTLDNGQCTPGSTLSSIKFIFDYSYNMGDVKFFDMKLREGVWEYAELNDDGQVVYSENSMSKYYETYTYNNDKQLISKQLILKGLGQEAESSYEYDSKGSLVCATDYSGIVTENVFDLKGNLVRTLKYHKDQPSAKFYSENLLDKTGKAIGEVNELGERVASYEYSDNSGRITAKRWEDRI